MVDRNGETLEIGDWVLYVPVVPIPKTLGFYVNDNYVYQIHSFVGGTDTSLAEVCNEVCKGNFSYFLQSPVIEKMPADKNEREKILFLKLLEC